MNLAGWLLVGLVGGLAAVIRYLIDASLAQRFATRFPVGIFAVNVTGAFLIGLAAGSSLNGQAMVIVAGGAIGSFTTFSTWIADSERLRKDGFAQLAWLNIGLSTFVGLVAVALGHGIVS